MQPVEAVRPGPMVHHIGKMGVQGEGDVSSGIDLRSLHGRGEDRGQNLFSLLQARAAPDAPNTALPTACVIQKSACQTQEKSSSGRLRSWLVCARPVGALGTANRPS